MSRLPREAFGRMKCRLNYISGSPDIEFAREEADQAVCLLGPDFKEGYAVFMKKRKPDFMRRGNDT